MQTTEPEWDDFNRAVVLASLDWTAELHSCGRPLSESLRTDGRPPPDYVVGELECTACRRSEAYVAKHHKKGVPPYTVLQVYTRAEAQAIHAHQVAGR